MISDDPVERWEQLEDYMKGHMDDEQHRRITDRLATDAPLADELTSVRRVHTLLSDAFAEQQMRDTLRQVRAGQPRGAVRRPGGSDWRRAPVWVAAACLLLLAYLSLTPIALPDAGYDVRALRQIDTTQLPAQQRVAFGNFFEGQALMVEGDYVQAARHFENVLAVDDLRPYFREAAEWHLAVSYLRSRQTSRAGRLYNRLRHCETCTYEVGWLERRKMEWQLLMASLVP